jgi:hypothetical protein
MSDMLALERAFEALETKGVITRHNYWCCGGCAGGALFNEYETNPHKDGIIGGVFYHEQSAEHALDGHGLTLYYDALPSGDFGERQRVIGEIAVAELKAQGLTVEWNGDPTTSIEITKFKVELSEIPEGTESSLHDTYGVSDYDPDEDEDEYDY